MIGPCITFYDLYIDTREGILGVIGNSGCQYLHMVPTCTHQPRYAEAITLQPAPLEQADNDKGETHGGLVKIDLQGLI